MSSKVSSRPPYAVILEQRVTENWLRGMLVTNVILNVELLLAKLPAVRTLESRRLSAVILEVSCHGALRSVTLATSRTRKARSKFVETSIEILILGPGLGERL